MPKKPVSLLGYVKPLLPFVPEIVPPPKRDLKIMEKMFYTLIALMIFLVMSQIPLYGIHIKKPTDAFYWLRIIIASNRGTLMELGISPIVTTSMVLQLLAGSKIIEVDQQIQQDRKLFDAVQKVSGIIMTFVQAGMYVSNGMYGEPKLIGPTKCCLLIFQLTAASVIVILLDEILAKGYGLGSGMNLFVAANICETIVWQTLSPMRLETPNGSMFEGAIVSFMHLLFVRNDKLLALQEALYRPYGANLTTLIGTAFIFCLVVYFQGFKITIGVKSTKVKSQSVPYPIKLFYTSSMPIILQSALVSNLYFISQLIFKKWKGTYLVALTGQWQEAPITGQSIPVGGLVYYMSPPQSILDFTLDPIRGVTYCIFCMTVAGVLSRWWIDVSGQSAKDVNKQLTQQSLMVVAGGNNPTQYLDRYIKPMATLGGVMVAILSILADLLGAVGSGTGILLAVNITYEYFEKLAKEQEVLDSMRSMMPKGGQILQRA